MTPGHRRLLRGGLTIGMLALVVYYFYTVNWASAWQVMRAASPTLLIVAAAANLATLVAKALIWWIFLRPIGVRSFPVALRATAAGAGLNNLLIANSGEAARAVLVTRAAGVPMSGVVAALALERLFDFIGYVLLLIGAASLVPLPHDVARWRPAAIALLAVIVVLMVALLLHAPAERPPATSHSLGGRAREAVARFVGRLARMVTGRRVAAALALTAVNWGTQIVSYHLTARAAQFPITVAGSITTLLTVNVGFLVRATPGNVGVFQLMYAVTAEALGLSRDAAVGVALLLQTIQNVPVTIIGAALAPDLVLARRARRSPAGEADARGE